MKVLNRSLLASLTTCLALGGGLAQAEVIITSTGTSWHGTSDSTGDPLVVSIDVAGNASYGGALTFGVTGDLATSGGSFTFALDAYKNVASDGTEGTDGIMGVNTTDGYGVDADPNSGGIGRDTTNREGYGFLVDTTNLGVGLQLTKVLVANFQGASESAFVHNIANNGAVEYSAATTNPNPVWIDVSAQNITIGANAGSTLIASLYSGDTGGFRIDGWEFAVVPEPGSLALLGLGGLLIARRRRA